MYTLYAAYLISAQLCSMTVQNEPELSHRVCLMTDFDVILCVEPGCGTESLPMSEFDI